MPTYDYACATCGQRIEVMHGVHDPGPTRCIACGGPMRKLLSTPTIVFKGSGWAKKDARDARPAAKPATAEKDGAGAAKESSPAGESASKGPAASASDAASNKARTDSAGSAGC